MSTATSIERGIDFLNQHVITDEVLEEYDIADESKELRPASDFSALLEEAFDAKGVKGDRLPWAKADDFRFKSSELTVWSGYSGDKKSMVLGQVCVGLLAQQKKVCIASFEMKPIQTLRRMYCQYAGTNVLEPEAKKRFFGIAEKLWMYQQVRSVKAENLLKIIRYSKRVLGVDHFVIDSLMRCGIAGTDFDKQKWFVDELVTVALDEGIHIHLVAHQKKPENGDQRPGTKYGIAGSGDISNLAHNVINVFENRDDNRAYDNLLTVQKQRNYDGESNPEPMFKFVFDSKSLQFCDQGTMRPSDWGVFGGCPK